MPRPRVRLIDAHSRPDTVTVALAATAVTETAMSDHDDPLIRAGQEANHLVAELRAKRKQQAAGSSYRPAFRPKGTRLPEDWILDPRNLGLDGYWRYMLDCERRVIDQARRQIAEDRPRWRQCFMEMVEFHLGRETDPDIAGLRRELRKVRRALGLKPTPETIREQTRIRMRRYRAREKKRA